jgi:hypothetical protein
MIHSRLQGKWPALVVATAVVWSSAAANLRAGPLARASDLDAKSAACRRATGDRPGDRGISARTERTSTGVAPGRDGGAPGPPSRETDAGEDDAGRRTGRPGTQGPGGGRRRASEASRCLRPLRKPGIGRREIGRRLLAVREGTVAGGEGVPGPVRPPGQGYPRRVRLGAGHDRREAPGVGGSEGAAVRLAGDGTEPLGGPAATGACPRAPRAHGGGVWAPAAGRP